MDSVLQSRKQRYFAVAAIAGSLALSCFVLRASAQEPGQKTFSSPGAAAHSLVEAAKSGDEQMMLQIFGTDGKEIVSSGDPEEDNDNRTMFVQRFEQMHRLVKEADGTVTLYIGAENWPFPLPLANKNGAWYFDTAVGKQEILMRRVGRNELSAIQVCHELVAAEKEHYAGAHPGEAGQYADHFSAEAGQHNGLYHPTSTGRPEIGPLLAHAALSAAPDERTPFHGYYFHILTKQGKKAPGGAKSYIVDGKMTAGFAFVAYPAEYKSSGVMTFIVNQDGTVYQKDLGPKTDSIATSIESYNPDKTWRQAEQ